MANKRWLGVGVMKVSPVVSPWVLQMSDETGTVTISVFFDEPTRELQSLTVDRSAGYQYHVLLLNNTIRYPVGDGTTTVSKAQLNADGLFLLGDILSYTLEP